MRRRFRSSARCRVITVLAGASLCTAAAVTATPPKKAPAAATPPVSPLRASADARLPAEVRGGTFRFGQATKATCRALYDGVPGASAVAARAERNWVDMADYVVAAGCGSDIAYFLLGEATEQIGYRAAALSYYQEASRIASTASFRFSEHCTLNKGGTGFQKAGSGCFNVPIEEASAAAVGRMQSGLAMLAEPTPGRSAAGDSLGAIEYAGAIPSGNSTIQQQLILQISGGQIVGRLKSQAGVLAGNVAVTGTYEGGRCTVQLRGGEDMVGPCDSDIFSGNFVERKSGKRLKPFWFATESRWARGAPAEVFGTPVQSTASAGEPSVRNSGVWSLGRVRFLVEPTGRCAPEVSLGTRDYCFNQAIDWLRRHPNKRSVDVVAMHDAWQLGSFVPHNSGQGWSIYEVSRQGETFTADKQRHYSTQVQVPQGCIYAGVAQQAWYITIARRGKVAVEAAQYACSNGWGGGAIYAQNLNTQEIDAAPGEVQISGAEMAQSGGGYQQATPNQAAPARGGGFYVPPMRTMSVGDASAIYGEPDVSPPPKPKKRKK